MNDRIREVLAQESLQPERWWWLSFADGALPEGEQFLGVAIVQGHGIATAVLRAHRLGINPGGEVRGLDLAHIPPEDLPADALRNRLLTRADCAAAGETLGRCCVELRDV